MQIQPYSVRLAVALVLALASSASAGVIFSEDFSEATPGPTYGVGTIGGTNIKVTSGNVDIVGVLNGSYFSCVDNLTGNCLDLIGASGSGGAISSVPTFNLTAGETYTLTFGVDLQGFDPSSGQSADYSVSLGSMSQILTATPISNPSVIVTFTPAANESNVSLLFTSITNIDGFHGPVLDHIVLSAADGAATPEPATYVMFASALSGLIFLRRRTVI